MRKPATKSYPPACKERAVKLAVESAQPIAQTARDLGGNAQTLPPWMGPYHRGERPDTQVQDEHRYAALQRLRTEPAR